MSVKRERRDSVQLVTFDRPAARNAINRDLARALVAALREAEQDERVATVVLASSLPQVFVAGGDLKELAKLPMDARGADQVMALGVELWALERCRLPVIAAVAGQVLGGGCELLCMCDLVVMAESAELRFVHAQMGLVPAWGGTTRLAERVGYGRASEILLGARPVSAEQALGMGLVQRVVQDGEALSAALAWASELGRHGRQALATMKQALLASRLARRGAALEAERKVFRSAWGSDPHRAAFAALEGTTAERED